MIMMLDLLILGIIWDLLLDCFYYFCNTITKIVFIIQIAEYFLLIWMEMLINLMGYK